MKKRYYLSMLSLFPLMLAFDGVYFSFHKSFEIFLSNGLFYFIIFVVLNFIGSYYIFRPIARILENGGDPNSVKIRINNLTWLSTGWIFFIGFLYTLVTFILLFLFPTVYSDAEVFTAERLPTNLILSFIPSLFFVHAIFPAFIAWFLINDYNLDLKTKMFTSYEILFPPGKKRIAIMLLFVFLVLGLLPTLLAILDIVSLKKMGAEYSEYTSMNPIETVLVDRFITLVGMFFAVVLIARAFTKPIYALLEKIKLVEAGDFTTQAAIITEDEVGALTSAFNEMVYGLQERELIRDTFGKYVTKDVANVVLGKKINVEGEVRACTILVTDIANYTSISESLSPKDTVTMLNEYYTAIVDVIQHHNGVVNKFMGDSLFAMFNVPLDDPDHAVHALLSAQEIQHITQTRTFGNNQQLETRIGINSGEVVAGNIGSPDRLEYTVMGDEVNIAARLEQLNKKYNSNILIGENTYQLAKDHFRFHHLADVQLEGKERVVSVYQLKGQ